MTGGRTRRVITLCSILTIVAAACGGADGPSNDDAAPNISKGIVVTAPVPSDETSTDDAPTEPDAEPTEPEIVSVDDADPAISQSEAATAGDDPEDDVEVTEADEDELDTMLNALNMFNSCLGEAGWELDGFPGDGSGRALEDFEPDYLTVLGACNSQSGIADAAEAFGESQNKLSADEIERINFGTPVFKECMEDLGWEVGDLIPDERGRLGFGETGLEMSPPGGGGLSDFNTDDIDSCRGEAERYVDDNFEERGS